MLIKQDDLKRVSSKIKIAQLGGEEITAVQEVVLNIPSGACLITVFSENGELMYFEVGKLINTGELIDVKKYSNRTAKDFFSATTYFEELCEKNQQKKPPPPLPSIGKFYYFREDAGRDCYVILSGSTDKIIIKRDDVKKSFFRP